VSLWPTLAASTLLFDVMAQAPPHTQAPPTFAAEVAAVYVDVFVTARDRPVAGLGTSDFVVTDDGVPQAATLVETDTVPLACLLLFDTSGSVKGQRLRDLMAAGHAFVDGLGTRDEGALLAFSDELSLLARPGVERASLQKALDGLRPGGATALYDALYVAFKLPFGQGRPLIVLFTDGEDNVSWLGREEVREAALQSSALLYVVAAGESDAPEAAFLRETAEGTGGRFWSAAGGRRLTERFLDVLGSMRSRYLLTYEPRGVKAGGVHRLKIEVKGRKVDVRHRREYVVSGTGPEGVQVR
jgi:Ca-activated chloride channel family protein